MEGYLYTSCKFPADPATEAHTSRSKTRYLPECEAIAAFESDCESADSEYSGCASNGETVTMMLIRVRDRELIAHREWKPVDPNQPELPLRAADMPNIFQD